jgi:hypothetical protein
MLSSSASNACSSAFRITVVELLLLHPVMREAAKAASEATPSTKPSAPAAMPAKKLEQETSS